MSRMSSMEEAYAKLDQDQIDEIEEKFAKADAAQKNFEKWNQKDIDRTILIAMGTANIKATIKTANIDNAITLHPLN
jgi:sulfoacetaldehyde dehydrogenase